MSRKAPVPNQLANPLGANPELLCGVCDAEELHGHNNTVNPRVLASFSLVIRKYYSLPRPGFCKVRRLETSPNRVLEGLRDRPAPLYLGTVSRLDPTASTAIGGVAGESPALPYGRAPE